MLRQNSTLKEPSLFEQKFYNSICSFMHTCQLFCAAPLNLQLIPKPLNHKTKCREKLVRFVHMAWCIIVLFSILISTYFQYSEFDSNMLSFLTRILYFGEYISGMLNSTIIIVGCHCQMGRYRDYFRRLISIDWKINTAGGKTSYLSTRKFLQQLLFGYFLFFVAVIVTDFMYNRMEAKSFLRSSTVYSIPNGISVLALSEYFFLLFCLRERYRQIIDVLAWLPQVHQWQMNHLPMNEASQSRKWQRVHEPWLPEATMEAMRQVCLDLTGLHSEINASFGVLIITTVVSTFLILSIQFYALYTFMENLQEENTWLTVYTVLWIVLHWGKSFFILYFNNAVNKEVN